jgi:hypothetical protein
LINFKVSVFPSHCICAQFCRTTFHTPPAPPTADWKYTGDLAYPLPRTLLFRSEYHGHTTLPGFASGSVITKPSKAYPSRITITPFIRRLLCGFPVPILISIPDQALPVKDFNISKIQSFQVQTAGYKT